MAILAGAFLSRAVTSNRDLAVASAVAFLFSELADFAVYQPLPGRRWPLAAFASNVVGLVIDSILFLQIAFGSLDFIEGQIMGKLWTTVLAVVVLLALRRWVIPRYSRPADEPTVPEIARQGAAGPPARWQGRRPRPGPCHPSGPRLDLVASGLRRSGSGGQGMVDPALDPVSAAAPDRVSAPPSRARGGPPLFPSG